jgi:hypothetical protein
LKIISGKKLGRENSEGILSGDQDRSRVLSAAGQIEQAEQHAGWTDPKLSR